MSRSTGLRAKCRSNNRPNCSIIGRAFAARCWASGRAGAAQPPYTRAARPSTCIDDDHMIRVAHREAGISRQYLGQRVCIVGIEHPAKLTACDPGAFKTHLSGVVTVEFRDDAL